MYYVSAHHMGLLFAFVVFVSAAICLFFGYLRKVRASSLCLVEAASIVQVFKMAEQLRANIVLCVENTQGEQLDTYSGICCMVNSTEVTVRCTTAPEGWNACPVQGYFMLQIKQKTRFYSFETTVSHIRRDQGDVLVTFPLPRALGNLQRRCAARFGMPATSLLGLSVWYYQVPTRTETPLGNDSTPQCEEKMHWARIDDTCIRIQDISITGVALMVPLDSALHPQLSATPRFILQIALRESSPESQQKQECGNGRLLLLIKGDVVRTVEDEQMQTLLMGVRFTSWARHGIEQDPQWVPVRGTEGVPPLNRWLLQAQRDNAIRLS